MSYEIELNELKLPVEFTLGPGGVIFARTPAWPGRCASGETPQEAAVALRYLLLGVCKRLIQRGRMEEIAMGGPRLSEQWESPHPHA